MDPITAAGAATLIKGSMMARGGLMLGSALYSAGSAWQAGEQAEREASVEAKGEELGAIQREGDRKERLAKAMSSSIAGAGASGIKAFSGSPLAILQEDVRKEEVATERDIFGAEMGASLAKTRGSVKKSAARVSAVTGLAGDAFKVAKVWPK